MESSEYREDADAPECLVTELILWKQRTARCLAAAEGVTAARTARRCPVRVVLKSRGQKPAHFMGAPGAKF